MPDDRQRAVRSWDERPTIGLLGAPMHPQQSFWIGVANAAEEYGVNLVVFLGGAIMPEELKASFIYDLSGVESAAVLYDLVNVEHLDGLGAFRLDHRVEEH